MKIYTKKGDLGHTSLGTGEAVHKADQRLAAYGTVDELSSFIGLAVSGLSDAELVQGLLWVQRKLFVVGSILAFPGRQSADGLGEIGSGDVGELERAVDEMTEQLPPLTDFIVPGGSKEASQLHCARSVCRRAERLVAGLPLDQYPLGGHILPFLNRLSDYLFSAARLVNQHAGLTENLAKR